MPKIRQKKLTDPQKEIFKNLFNEWLISNDRKELAKKHGFTREHIDRILRSVNVNEDVFNEALDLVNKAKAAHEATLNEFTKVRS